MVCFQKIDLHICIHLQSTPNKNIGKIIYLFGLSSFDLKSNLHMTTNNLRLFANLVRQFHRSHPNVMVWFLHCNYSSSEFFNNRLTFRSSSWLQLPHDLSHLITDQGFSNSSLPKTVECSWGKKQWARFWVVQFHSFLTHFYFSQVC